MIEAKLFRRDDVPDRKWVAFAFDLNEERHLGFVTYDALEAIAAERAGPERMFDLNRSRILKRAAEKVASGELDAGERALIDFDDPLCAAGGTPDR